MIQQLTREQVNTYLDNRATKGFTVIQTVAFWYPHGGGLDVGPHNAPNAYGHRPFMGGEDHPDTSEPRTVRGGSPDRPNDYWDHADYVIRAARSRGLHLAVLPCWGNAYVNNRMPQSRIEFTEEEARTYGRFLGRRYRNAPHLIWVLGGDVDPVTFGDKDQRSVYRAMAEGIGRGVSGNETLVWDQPHADWDASFMTFHAVQAPKQSGARGGSSSLWFHADPWLDVNMMETFAWTDRVYPLVARDYGLSDPVKPTILGEGAYEDGVYGHECDWVTPLRIRWQAYQCFFAGGAGHTYGHWAIWPFRGSDCCRTWNEALDRPGAADVATTLKAFLVRHAWQTLKPAPSLLLQNAGAGETLQCVLRDETGSNVLVYHPRAQPAALDWRALPDPKRYRVSWFDPRNGHTVPGRISTNGTLVPPAEWEDAVTVLAIPETR
jgi:hypothetical protein